MWRDWLSSARSDEDEETPEVRQKRMRQRRRWLLGASLIFGLLFGGAFAAYRFGGQWLERRTRVRVGEYIAEQDYRRVQLTLEQAVQVSPHSLEARRALAEFYEIAGSPLAVARWQEAVNLAPDDDELRFRLASVALRLQGAAEARAALGGVSPAGQKTVGYYRIAAGIALAEGKAEELQNHLVALAALEPANDRTKVALASLQLRSADPAVATKAREELEQLARGESQRIHATLALLLDAAPRGENGVREIGARVLPPSALQPGISIPVALLEYLKAAPHPSADDAAALVEWMVSRGLARDALLWIGAQGTVVQNAPRAQAARAMAAIQLRDWRLLRELLVNGAWGRVSPEAVELAFAARLQRERAGVTNAKETFGDALELAAPSLSTLKALNRLCAIWNWPEESERVLNRLVHDFPREQSAWLELLARAEAGGKSSRYWELARQRAQIFPGDPAVQALRTYAAIVTNQDDPAASKAARLALTRQDALPDEIAAGLLLLWREQGAQDALAGLSAEQIKSVQTSRKGALVYGAMLSAVGKDTREALSRISSDNLLPEERVLLSRARSGGP
jgi:hypothetical protein